MKFETLVNVTLATAVFGIAGALFHSPWWLLLAAPVAVLGIAVGAGFAILNGWVK